MRLRGRTSFQPRWRAVDRLTLAWEDSLEVVAHQPRNSLPLITRLRLRLTTQALPISKHLLAKGLPLEVLMLQLHLPDLTVMAPQRLVAAQPPPPVRKVQQSHQQTTQHPTMQTQNLRLQVPEQAQALSQSLRRRNVSRKATTRVL